MSVKIVQTQNTATVILKNKIRRLKKRNRKDKLKTVEIITQKYRQTLIDLLVTETVEYLNIRYGLSTRAHSVSVAKTLKCQISNNQSSLAKSGIAVASLTNNSFLFLSGLLAICKIACLAGVLTPTSPLFLK